MTRRPRRNHLPACKAKVALAAIQGEITITEMAQKFDLHANQTTQWKARMLEHAVDGFEAGSSFGAPPVDIIRLHAKIGELTLENDFLEGALTRTGWLSAKR
jgi:transposase